MNTPYQDQQNQHHNFGNSIVLNKSWSLDCWQQITERYASIIHISFLSYEFQDQCHSLWWICSEQKNKIVNESIFKCTSHDHFWLSSHTGSWYNDLVLDFCNKRNFSIKRVVVCQTDSVGLYHSCQRLHKLAFEIPTHSIEVNSSSFSSIKLRLMTFQSHFYNNLI